MLDFQEIFLSRADKAGTSLLSLRCKSFYLFFLLPSSLSSPCICHLSLFPGTSSPSWSSLLHSPFIKFYGKLKADKHAEFPQSQPHSFSSSQSPAASAATSNYISSLPSLYPLLSLSPFLTSSSHRFIKLSPMSLKFQCMCHATPVTPTPRVTAFHKPELPLILILSGCRLA